MRVEEIHKCINIMVIFFSYLLRRKFHSFSLKKKERQGLDRLCGNVFIFSDEIAPHCTVLQNERLSRLDGNRVTSSRTALLYTIPSSL